MRSVLIFNCLFILGGGFRIGNAVMYMDIFQTWVHLLKENHNINALILSVDYSKNLTVKYYLHTIEQQWLTKLYFLL
jgi:hypothetical protein